MQHIEQEAIRLINEKMKEKGWNPSIMSRKLGVHQSTVAKMLQSPYIKLRRLKQISDLFGYNFLRVLADQLELNDPPKYPVDAVTQRRMLELEIENAILLKLLANKQN
jgi:lambda repressor-like predicted transcriptional regulator